jgi:broad specificity phosphatase PhoE/8-oxo-dGTP pyrophosphatase MutT (NUDIX family)/predicted GNAT family acetyltransferase
MSGRFGLRIAMDEGLATAPNSAMPMAHPRKAQDAAIKAAGLMIVTPDGHALFLKRSDSQDHPGEWCFPAGGAEGDEDPKITAIRETREETGWTAPEGAAPLERVDERDGFTTFRLDVNNPFIPTLDDEHVGWAWAPLSDPPQPLHPGVMATLKNIKIANDAKQEISVSMPLLIRLMEFAREDASGDLDLHQVAERISEKSGSLDMDEYDALVQGLGKKQGQDAGTAESGGSRALLRKTIKYPPPNLPAKDDERAIDLSFKRGGAGGTLKESSKARWYNTTTKDLAPGQMSSSEMSRFRAMPARQQAEIISLLERIKALKGRNPEKAAQLQKQVDRLAGDDWEESKHPRDENGKFGAGGGGGGFEEKYSKSEYEGKTQFILKSGKIEVGEIATVKRPDGNLEVSNVLVWPKFQRKGYATKLYKQAFEDAKSRGKKLFISDDRTENAKSLHETFSKSGHLKSNGQIVFDEWEESKHPRGQPGNAGQFGPGGAGGGHQEKTVPERTSVQEPSKSHETHHKIGTPGLVAKGLEAADAVKKQWVKESPIKTVDDLFVHAKENQEAFGKVSDMIAKEVDEGTTFQNPGVKGRKRVEEKVRDGKPPGRINDVVRGGFIVHTRHQSDAIVKRLAEKFEIADEGWAMTPAGYFDRKVIVRFHNGMCGEVQLWNPDLLAAKKQGHKLYEEQRALPLHDPRRAVLEQQMKELYGQVTGKLGEEWCPPVCDEALAGDALAALDYGLFDGDPFVYSPGEAWVFINGKWRRWDSAEVAMEGRIISKADFEKRGLPPLPDEAFKPSQASDAKVTQATAQYINGPIRDKPCKMCSMFLAGGACSKVEGKISPEGHCRFWAAKSARDQARDTEFKESDHPRDEDGKFGSGGGYSKNNKNNENNDIQRFIGESAENSAAINKALRTGGKLTADQDRVVKSVDAAIASATPLDKDMTLWRGDDQDRTGKIDAGFTFGSENRETADDYATTGRAKPGVIYKVTVPKGTRALGTKGLQDPMMSEEQAWILPRGGKLEKIREKKSWFGKNKVREIEARYIASARTQARDAEFKESDHPRDEDGKFGSGGGGAPHSKHVAALKEAGINNREKFDAAFNALKADKGVKVEDLKKIIAEHTQGKVPIGKTRDALLDEIRKDWVRRSRFENKIAGDDNDDEKEVEEKSDDKEIKVKVKVKIKPAEDAAGETTIILVRHGKTKLNNETDTSVDRIRGWKDVPLIEEGREEARKAAKKLAKEGDIVALYSSDLSRAAETAKIIGEALGLKPRPTKGLRPWNLGKFTGETTKESLPQIAEYAREKPDEAVPDGESFNDFCDRYFGELSKIIDAHRGEKVLIIPHHRNERLLTAWDDEGQPADKSFDMETFLKKGDPPGGIKVFKIKEGKAEGVVGDALAFDRASVRELDKDGRLEVEITPISKANVCPYLGREIPGFEQMGLDPEKIYQLYRDPDELEKAASTFNNLPVLSEHIPVFAADYAETSKKFVIGTTGEICVFKAPYLLNSLKIWDGTAVEKIRTGEQKEISCGYHYQPVLKPGTTPGGVHYDGVMTNIVGNHVALVKEGRAGADVVVGDSRINLEWTHLERAILFG